MNLLLVCTGNTCRSPMAEGLCRYLNTELHTDVTPLSVGLRAFAGMGVMPEAVKAVADKVDISEHKARLLSPAFVKASDCIVVMTEDQKEALQVQYPDYADRVMTLAEFGGETGDVEDPYAHPQFVYDRCAGRIEDLLRKGWHRFTTAETPEA